MKMIYNRCIIAISMLLFVSCYEDKGNYTYSETEKIEITFPDNIVAMSRAEYVTFSPKVVSSIVGEIKADNSNYEFNCKMAYSHRNPETGRDEMWLDVNAEKKKDLNFFADFPANTYQMYYSVTNKETGVATGIKGYIKVLSSTYEGWMVLSNVGIDDEVRVDMISKDSKGETVIALGVLGEKAPSLKRGTALVISPSLFANAEAIYLMSYSGAYRLNVDDLQASEDNNIKFTDFILPTTPGAPLSLLSVHTNYGGAAASGPLSRVCVTDLGDAYAITSGNSGASFEFLMNTDKPGEDRTYQVSPMIGTSMARVGNSSCVLLYDVTNKRFVGWNYSSGDNHLLFSLNDPGEGQKFSYTTGMTLIDMESTRYSDGLVYSVLEDNAHKRYVYGINLSGSKFAQESVYENVTAEHFNDAIDYAFHSQYPFMFYCHGNKIYSYNLGTHVINEIKTLNADETVTKLKFNLYQNMDLKKMNDQSDEFMAKQFQLIVGSTTKDENGGIVRFYSIDVTGKMTLEEEYKGFGKVVDVTYRERRAG